MAMTILTFAMLVRPQTVRERELGKSQALAEPPDLHEAVALARNYEVPIALAVEETTKNRMRTVISHGLPIPSFLPGFALISNANYVAKNAGSANVSIAALSCVSKMSIGLKVVRREMTRTDFVGDRNVATRKNGYAKGYESDNSAGTGVEAGALHRIGHA